MDSFNANITLMSSDVTENCPCTVFTSMAGNTIEPLSGLGSLKGEEESDFRISESCKTMERQEGLEEPARVG